MDYLDAQRIKEIRDNTAKMARHIESMAKSLALIAELLEADGYVAEQTDCAWK